MNLKILIIKKGVSQIELARRLGINPAVLSLQVNKHRLLPEKHLASFCNFLGITKEELISSMEAKEASHD
jgi:transcriptional regulator with XRE-family HTH domain